MSRSPDAPKRSLTLVDNTTELGNDVDITFEMQTVRGPSVFKNEALKAIAEASS